IACEDIDPVKECCYQICHNAILEAATTIASKGSNVLDLPEHSIRVNDCRNIVLRWIASKLDPSHAKKVLRGLSNCRLNKVCPLVLPEPKQVAKGCGHGIRNKTACCNAMESYVSHVQKQTFVTNLQALGCAETLAMKLKKSNVTDDVYSLCRITLKDFSPQDAIFDSTTGVTFLCDLNDNIPAPWPSTSQVATSSCNKCMYTVFQ
ncbi:putative GPI-anchored protein, partial [Trifolium medium]|nr:putative GPI-anchored protein [Trifolium medium]